MGNNISRRSPKSTKTVNRLGPPCNKVTGMLILNIKQVHGKYIKEKIEPRIRDHQKCSGRFEKVANRITRKRIESSEIKTQ